MHWSPRAFAAFIAVLVVAAGVFAVVGGTRDSGAEQADGGPINSSTTVVANASTPLSVSNTVPQWSVDIEERLDDEPASTDASGPFDAVVLPGESIQAVVNTLPEGSRILIAAGVHAGQQVKPKSGMVFVGESGAVLDGQNATEYAFVAFAEDEADNVTIHGLEIRNYRPSFDTHGAIMASHRAGWVVENCEIHHNAFSGINVGSNSIVRSCFIHHNGRIGLKANGQDVLIRNNEISFNNPEEVADPLWEAGGIKFIESGGMVIRNNYIHDNNGSGIWADIDANNTVIESNVVENNTHAGIDFEISSGGVIRNNTVRFNGHGHTGGWMWGAGITIRGPHVLVYGNVIQGNYNGIALIQTGRGSQYDLRDVTVRDNLIVNSGQNGGVRSAGPSAIFDTSLFEENEYRYDNIDGDLWLWDNVVMSRDEWTSAGNDLSGTFSSG